MLDETRPMLSTGPLKRPLDDEPEEVTTSASAGGRRCSEGPRCEGVDELNRPCAMSPPRRGSLQVVRPGLFSMFANAQVPGGPQTPKHRNDNMTCWPHSLTPASPSPSTPWSFVKTPCCGPAPSPNPSLATTAATPGGPFAATPQPPQGGHSKAQATEPCTPRYRSPSPRSPTSPCTPPTRTSAWRGSGEASTPWGTVSPRKFWGSPGQMGMNLLTHPPPPPPPPCPSTPHVANLLSPWEMDLQLPCSPMIERSQPPIGEPAGRTGARSLIGGMHVTEDRTATMTEDPNEGRFRREFTEVVAIGRGQFSTVYSAKSRTDQHSYAVKVMLNTHGSDVQAPSREVFALANLAAKSSTPHLVRYFSSWWEDGALHIQTELCAGSLRAMLERRAADSICTTSSVPAEANLSFDELVVLLRHVANGLKELHAHGFAHLDVKPDNILTAYDVRTPVSEQVFKLADLGLVAAANAADDVVEGDSRYVAREMLHKRDFDPCKADVFSTALVIYEAATYPRPLPPNGEEWQQLRRGQLDLSGLPSLPQAFVSLLVRAAHADHRARPTSAELAEHPCVAPPSHVDDEIRLLREELRQAKAEAEEQRLLAKMAQQPDGAMPRY